MKNKVLMMSLMMSALSFSLFAQIEKESEEEVQVESCLVSFCEKCDDKN